MTTLQENPFQESYGNLADFKVDVKVLIMLCSLLTFVPYSKTISTFAFMPVDSVWAKYQTSASSKIALDGEANHA